MPYKPSDNYYKEFVTASPTTGAAANADSLPVATANRNGADDGSFALTVTNLDAGRYKVVGAVPSGYAAGDVVNVSVAATVGGVAGKAVVDTFGIDVKRVGDLNDITAAAVWAATTRTLSAFGFSVTVGSNTDKTGYSLSNSQTFSTSGSVAAVGTAVAVGGYSTGQDPATLVLDALASNHAIPNTVGSKITAAGSAGDPWSTAIPGSYGAGTAGAVVGNNLNATVGSRLASASYSAPPTAAQVSTAVWTDAAPGDFGTTGSPGKILVGQLGGAFASTPSVFTAASLANAPSGSGSGVLASNGLDNIVVETGVNARQALSLAIAGMAGKVSGAGTGTVNVNSAGPSDTARISAAVDGSGNRTAVSLTLPT